MGSLVNVQLKLIILLVEQNIFIEYKKRMRERQFYILF